MTRESRALSPATRRIAWLVGGLLLAAAVLWVPIYMHAYWREEGEARANEQAHFYKTVSVLGGAVALFALFAREPGLGLTVTGPLFPA